MAELSTGNDQSAMSAAPSDPLGPLIKPTSDHRIGALIAINPTEANLEKAVNLASPCQATAHAERANGKSQSSASREIAQIDDHCKLRQDVHIVQGVINRSCREDHKFPVKPAIKEQLAEISGQSKSGSPRNAQQDRKRRPPQELRWEGIRSSYSPEKGEVEEEEEEEEEEGVESACVTPTAREQRISQNILICPPPPCKKRHCSSKRKRDVMDPSSSSPTQAHAAANLQVMVNPPDLHTFPECIRALFNPS